MAVDGATYSDFLYPEPAQSISREEATLVLGLLLHEPALQLATVGYPVHSVVQYSPKKQTHRLKDTVTQES